MGTDFSKLINNPSVRITALVFSFMFLANSCQFDDSDILQVYNENGTKYNGTIELVGLPLAWLDSGYHPWKLYGRIINGKMAIDFPDVKLELGSDNKYCLIYIEQKNSGSTKFGLYKKSGADDFNRVYIFYSTGNFYEPDYYTGDGIAFKAGWNFIEEMKTPNWSYDNDEPYYINGLISQDINDFYRKGYRWQLERWT